jgi:hypothetical protein
MDQPPEPHDNPLSHEQQARAFALGIARPFLTNTGLASKISPAPDDLITVATWIIQGPDHTPLYPYADTDAKVHLGPTVWMQPDGYLWVNGSLYVPSPNDEHEEGDDA